MLIKKLRSSLTFKICMMIAVLLLAASGLTYAAVAGFLPAVYSNQLEESLDALSQEMAKTLNSYESVEKASAALELFAASTELSVAVLDENGVLVWPERKVIEMHIEAVPDAAEDAEESAEFAEGTEEAEDSAELAGGTEEAEGSAELADGMTDAISQDAVGGVTVESMPEIDGEVNEDTCVVEESVQLAEGEAVAVSSDEVWDTVVSGFLDAAEDPLYLAGEEELTYDYVSDAELAGFYGKDASAVKQYDLKLGDTEYVMLVAGGMQPVNQAMEILRQIFPRILGVAVLISVLFALAGSAYLTAPVVRLSRISRRMAALDFSDKYTGRRHDELGELGRNLNEMAANLSDTLKNLKLANDKLKSDIELERQLERKRIAFFSAVSHELKTPITILKGHISGMLRGIGAYQDRDYYLLRSQETTEKMEEMVGELLTVSRMESNTFVTQITDLAELMRLQLAELTELIEEKELELEAELPEHLYAEVNSGMMEKVFRNFLTNAIRYTPAGGNQIRVFLSGAPIFCSVENTGTHIPETALPHLFDAFYRVESSRSRKTGGSGLGLYIVRMALEQHGARYGAENTREGVRFFFEL